MAIYKRTELLTTLKHVGTLLVDPDVVQNASFLALFDRFNVRVLKFDEDELICNDDVAAILTDKRGVFEDYFTVVLADGIEFRYPFVYGWVSWDVPGMRMVRMCEMGERIREMRRMCGKEEELVNGSRGVGEQRVCSGSEVMSMEGSSVSLSAFSRSDKSLMDLLIIKREKHTQRNMQRYIQHLKKCAMSLFAGASMGRIELFKKGSSTKRKLSSKQQQIIKQNEERLKKINEQKDGTFLRNFFVKFKSMSFTRKRMALESVRTESAVVNRRITLLKIEYYLDRWRIESRKERVDERMLVDVYVNCLAFFEIEGRERSECEYVESVMREIGFGATADELLGRDGEMNAKDGHGKNRGDGHGENAEDGHGENAKDGHSIDGTGDKKVAVNDLDVYFQLKFAGDKLKRTLDSQKDERTTFLVDSWQKKLLDAVDSDTSCVISAPTSSGKTFICFYAIEKAIAEGRQLIFCVPTKALVNQVAADILIRFGDRCKYGIVMPDYQVNAQCDVLVTVPMMLEALLESDLERTAETAHKRNKPGLPACHDTIVIIDEIHKINSDEMGAYIERSVHKVKGLLIVLSATLGDNNRVYEWIRAVEGMKGKECVLVEHKERYCELRNYYYNGEMVGISPLVGYGGYVHEDGGLGGKSRNCLDVQTGRECGAGSGGGVGKNLDDESDGGLNGGLKGMPGHGPDLHPCDGGMRTPARSDPLRAENANLLPEDVLKLYYSVFEIIKENKALKKEYKALRFKKYFKSNIITKKDVRAYCSSIFAFVKKHGLMKQTIELMNRETEDAFKIRSDVKELNNLIETLKKSDMLPCIVFNMDRECVNEFAVSLFNLVQKNEVVQKVARIKVPKNKSLVKKRDEWMEESAREEEMSNAVVPRDDYMIEKISDEELDELVADVRVNPVYKKMLYYGIGVHHNGMNKKYREIVEILFRNKNLGVVFCTHTLSLGINMPCKTVVFAGDSDRLDRISVVQMSGRAGRRGYDTIGHVIFVGFEGYRIRRLMRDGESVVKGYSNSVYGWMWAGGEYMRSMAEHCFSVLADDRVVGTDEDSGNRGGGVHASSSTDGSENRAKHGDGDDNSAMLTDQQRGTASSALHPQLTSIIERSPYQRQIENVFAVLVRYDFIKVENGTFYRTKWGDLLLFNEMSDPLLFLILLRNGAIDLDGMSAKTFFMVLCHFVEVRWTYRDSGDAPPILEDLPERVERCLAGINAAYPTKLKITPTNTQLIPPFLHAHPCQRKDAYLYNFFVGGRKGCEHIPMGDLWQICFRVNKLLGSLVEVLDGKGKRVVKDVNEVFKTKFEELHA